jgi:ADP-L-glycero-D-manno-heptose 6-epimerase
MIVLTGAGGFIGSVILGYLNKQGIDDIVLFDDLPTGDQFKNLVGKRYVSLHSTDEMFESASGIEAVIHFGANSSTLERDWSSIYRTNVLSTRFWNRVCLENNIPFIFASSAAVYGNGNGPLNHYAFSKSVSENEITGVILRLFNVYGPNEYHKDRMASTIFHWYNQLSENGEIKIFENSSEYFRDFIYVEDVARVILHFLKNYKPGIYDLGTGKSVSFEHIADAVIENNQIGTKKYVLMPEDLRNQYQLNTQANIENLKKSGFDIDTFLPPSSGIRQYFSYLIANSRY